jgi:hypothetical protein
MGKKILGILVCLLFLLTTISTVAARQERTVYKNCYVEVEAQTDGLYNMLKYVFFRPRGDNSAFVLCWILQWMGPDLVTVKIYDQKNGTELWNNGNQEAIWATKFFFYSGLYTWSTENEHSVLNLQGTAKAVVVLTEG